MDSDTEPKTSAPESEPGLPVTADKKRAFRQPGFGLGLGIGAITVVVLFVLAVGVLGLVYLRTVSDEFAAISEPAANVTLSPVEADEVWFSIDDDETGVLEGWSYGSYGDGESTQYSFDVFELGSVDGLPIQHVITMGADNKTKFFIGDRPYEAPDSGGRSAADSIFGNMGDEGNPITDGEMRLVVEFRRDGDILIATKVTADPSGPHSPYLW